MKELVIVIDMQNDFVDGVLGSEDAKKIVAPQVAFLEKVDCPIWFTLDTHTYYDMDPESVHLPVPHCIKGSRGWELIDPLKKFASQKDSLVIEKSTFGSVLLAQKIHAMEELRKITLFGLDSDICVASNALIIKAFRPDIQIVVKEDLCAGSSRENHKAAMQVMHSCHCDIC